MDFESDADEARQIVAWFDAYGSKRQINSDITFDFLSPELHQAIATAPKFYTHWCT